MYINGLLEIFNEHSGAFVVDERAGFRAAGLGRFARSKGGHLHDDPSDGRVLTVQRLELMVSELVTAEQGMMLQNLELICQAMGLGGFPTLPSMSSVGLKPRVFAWARCQRANISARIFSPARLMRLLRS